MADPAGLCSRVRGRAEIEPGARGLLGSGSFAETRRGTYRFRGQQVPTNVAFKIFRGAGSDALRDQIMRELNIGIQLRHQTLVRMWGLIEHDDCGRVLVMELVLGGSLANRLKDKTRDSPWACRMAWLAGITKGMVELHQLKPRMILHRDL